MATNKKNKIPAPPVNALHIKEYGDGSATASTGGFVYRHIFIILSFVIPFTLMYTAFAVFNCQPFGTADKQILVTDLWHQYFPFLVDFQDKLKNGESLLWSWTQGGGTNYLSLASYYLASPFNLLMIFIPSTVEAVNIFLTFSVAFKIGMAGLFCAFFLRYAFKRYDISILIFSVCFAFSAHFMGYYWCHIWLDTVALTPLVALGFLALMREGKYRVYIIALALSLFSNYYIGFFTCIFMVLCFIGYSIIKWDNWRGFGRRLLRMTICSLTAGMITAILILPAFFGLQTTHASDSTFPEIYAINANYLTGFQSNLEGTTKMMQLTFGNTFAFINPTTVGGSSSTACFPNIACGVLPIIFFMVFLASGKVKAKEKVFNLCLLIFFVVSFIDRQLDYMWHGFHFPNQIPYRYSYLFSFIVIVAAYRAFSLLEKINFYDLAITLLVTPLFFLYTADIDPTVESGNLNEIIKNYDTWIKSVNIAVVIILMFTAYVVVNNVFKILSDKTCKKLELQKEALRNPKKANKMTLSGTTSQVLERNINVMKNVRRISKVVFCSFMLVLVVVESGITAFIGVEVTKVTTVNDYPRGGEKTVDVVNHMKELEENTPELWRAEFTSTQTLCDSSLNKFKGISMFNSMTNENHSRFAENFGIMGWLSGNRYTYAESSPVTNMFLNLKYIISRDGNYNDTRRLAEVYSNENVKLLENKSYIPMGVMTHEEAMPASELNEITEQLKNADEEDPYKYNTYMTDAYKNLLDYQGEDDEDDYNPFEKQNEFFRLATGLKEDVYTKLDVVSQGHTSHDIFPVTRTEYGKYNFSDNSGGSATLKLKWNYTAPEDGCYYAYVQLRNNSDYKDLQNVSILRNDVSRDGTNSFYIKRPYIMSIGFFSKGDKISVQANPSSGANGYAVVYVNKLNDEVFEKGRNILKQNTMTTTLLSGNKMEGEIDVSEDGLFLTSIPYEYGQTDDDTLIGKLFASKSEGWTAYVDGEEVKVTPVANALVAFRLSKGKHNIRLVYYPKGFKKGAVLTCIGLILFIGYTVFLFVKKMKARKGTAEKRKPKFNFFRKNNAEAK